MIRYKSCGIDVSADVFDAGLWVKNKRQTCWFANDPSGFEALRSWLKSFSIYRAWFAIEHTGGYERALALYLVDFENQVSLVDGLKVQRFKESCGAKAKTDSGDALFLAKYAAQHQPPLWTPLPNAYQKLLELVRHRQSLVGDLTRWKNRRAAPCTNEFVHAQHETIIEVLRLQIEQAEAAVRACVQSDPELAQSVALLCTAKGIKELTATAFIAEAGPISQYPTPESLALEAGLAPLPHLSGKSAKGTYTRPYGNQRLRDCLNMSASTAKRFNPALKQFAERMKANGKSDALQVKAVKRKLVHIIWGILHSQEPFDPAKAIANYSDRGA